MSACVNSPDCTAVEHMLCCPSPRRVAEHILEEGDEVTFSDSRGVIAVAKIGARMPMSHGYALSVGIPGIVPTLEEKVEQDRQRAELDAKRAVVAARVPAELARLDAIADPVSRLVLDLHRRTPDHSRWECPVCFDGGDMGDRIEWPCCTTEAIATYHGIDLRDFWLFTRPDDGSLDAPTPEDQ